MEFGSVGPEDKPEPEIMADRRELAKTLAAALEKICAVQGVEPRFPFLTGFCLLKAGEKDKAMPWLEKALDGALALRDTPNPTTARTAARVACETARAAFALFKDALLERSCNVYMALKANAYWGEKMSFRASSQDESRNPVALWSRRLIVKGRYVDFFRLMEAPTVRILPSDRGVLEKELKDLTTPAAFAEAVLKSCEKVEDHLRLADMLVEFFHSDKAAIDLLEKARERFKGEVNLHFELARLLAARQEWDRAFAVAQSGIKEARDGGTDAERLVLYAARLSAHADRKAEGAALLAERHGVASPFRASHWAEAHVAVGNPAEATKFYQQAERNGEKPNFPLATHYFQTGDLEKALQYYNRDLGEGSPTRRWSPEEALPFIQETSDAPASAADGRDRILKKLGPDYFIDRLVTQQAGKASDELARKVSELLSLLEKGTDEQRHGVRDALVKLGPASAPLLKPALSGKAEWIAALIRDVLSEWAEPR